MGAMQRRSSTSRHWVALLLASALSLSAAYPELFVEEQHANGCTDMPTRGLGAHGAPTPDRTTTFTLSRSGSRQPEAAVCPGVAYDLVVDYAGVRRRTLIAASAGKFTSSGALPADPKCPNRAASSSSSSTYTNKITLPCDTKAPRLLLNVTSAGGSSDKFHLASTSIPITPLAQCPGSTCPGAPAAGSRTAPAPAATAPAAPAVAAAAAPAGAEPASRAVGSDAPAAAAASLQRGTAGGCRASAYKYACAVDAQQGATLHYTLGDSPTPPDNACTASAAAGASSTAGGDGQQQYLHMLLESPAQGYSGLGFPAEPGKMYPTDAVIGYVDPATGQPVVSAYHLTNFSPTKSAVSNGLGWASHMGAAKPGNGGSLLCFSRPVDAPTAPVVKKLDTSDLKLTWVGDSGTSFSQEHALVQSMALNAAAGSVTSTSTSSKLAKQLAHGALMLLAFSVFMPLGALMARHKWIMGDKEKGGIRPGWFHVHRAIQSLAVLLALAGFILALVSFEVPWSNMTAASTPHELYNPHRVLGVIVMALCFLQVVGGVMRPGLNHQRRPHWRKGHTLLGWLALAAGTAVVFMGAVMMHDMADAPYINWLLPICLFLGLVLLAGVAAEVRKSKLERQGRYDPSTHTYLHSGTSTPGSTRSSGTGTPEVEVLGGKHGHKHGDKEVL